MPVKLKRKKNYVRVSELVRYLGQSAQSVKGAEQNMLFMLQLQIVIIITINSLHLKMCETVESSSYSDLASGTFYGARLSTSAYLWKKLA